MMNKRIYISPHLEMLDFPERDVLTESPEKNTNISPEWDEIFD